MRNSNEFNALVYYRLTVTLLHCSGRRDAIATYQVINHIVDVRQERNINVSFVSIFIGCNHYCQQGNNYPEERCFSNTVKFYLNLMKTNL